MYSPPPIMFCRTKAKSNKKFWLNTTQLLPVKLKLSGVLCAAVIIFVSFSNVPDPDRMFLSLLNSNPSINKQKKMENLDLYCIMPSLRLFIFDEWCTVNGSGTLVFSFISTLELTLSWFLLKFQVLLTSIPVHKFLNPYCIIRNHAFLNTWSFTFLISKLSNLLQIRVGKVNTTRPGFKTWSILFPLILWETKKESIQKDARYIGMGYCG